ncbi:hypothetical protein [Bifidobacterium favimelis]
MESPGSGRLGAGIMEDFHLSHLCAREFRELSGGESQRLMLARGPGK